MMKQRHRLLAFACSISLILMQNFKIIATLQQTSNGIQKNFNPDSIVSVAYNPKVETTITSQLELLPFENQVQKDNEQQVFQTQSPQQQYNDQATSSNEHFTTNNHENSNEQVQDKFHQPTISNFQTNLPTITTQAAIAIADTTSENSRYEFYPPRNDASSIINSQAQNYYFSSTESEVSTKPSHIWWALGVGVAHELASNLTHQDYLDFCDKSSLLVSFKQRLLCKQHHKIIPVVARGIKMAINECQERFKHNRWNCTVRPSFNRDLKKLLSMDINGLQSKPVPQIFGEIMNHQNRERSFLNALISAGIAHSITQACSKSELDDECSCDKRIASNKKDIKWVGCSDDIDFGAKFSRDFTDSSDTAADPSSMISLHNYEVGRKLFKKATDITCNCQAGDKGLCTTNRCWEQMSQFKEIGHELFERYRRATHVQPSAKKDPKGPVKLRPVKRGVKKPRRKDLVFIDDSPDYCSTNMKLGILGTKHRVCNSTSDDIDNCNLLCCGRGYQTVTEDIEEDCECKFVWCCEVKCQRCKKHVVTELCN